MTTKTGEIKSTKDFWNTTETTLPLQDDSSNGSPSTRERSGSAVKDTKNMFEQRRRTSARNLSASGGATTSEPEVLSPIKTTQNGDEQPVSSSGHKPLRRTSSLLSSRGDNIFIQQEKQRLERKSSLKEGQMSVETIEKAKALAEGEKAKLKASQEETNGTGTTTTDTTTTSNNNHSSQETEQDESGDKNEKDSDDLSGFRRKLQRRTQRDEANSKTGQQEQEPDRPFRRANKSPRDRLSTTGKDVPPRKNSSGKEKTAKNSEHLGEEVSEIKKKRRPSDDKKSKSSESKKSDDSKSSDKKTDVAVASNKVEDEKARRAAALAAAKRRKDEKKKQEEEQQEQGRLRAQQEAEQKEKDKKKKEEDEKLRLQKLQEEAQKAFRKKQEEEAKRKQEEEQKRKLEEELRKRKEEEEKKQQEELKRKQAEEEEKERLRKKQEEEAKKKQEAQAKKEAKKEKDVWASSSESEEEDPLEKATNGIKNNTASVVDLKMEGLDDSTIATMLMGLTKNSSVKEVLLDGNEMGVNSFMQINDLLIKNNSVTLYSLNFVMLGELGSRTIADGLAKNSIVETLLVSGNDLFENGMAALGVGLKKNTKVKTLNLSENSISDAGCKCLMDILSINQTITHLDISNNYINEEGAAHLAKMLEYNSSLRHLNLERNSLEDLGCIAFSEALYKNTTLRELLLGNNIIDTEGVQALSAALHANKSLEYVDLKQNIDTQHDIESGIALQDVIIAKKGSLRISWKKPPAKGDPPISKADINTIINHFGPSRILSFYASGVSLEPLIETETLLQHILYTTHEAQQLWNIAFPLKGSGYSYPLDAIIRIFQHQLAENPLQQTNSSSGSTSGLSYGEESSKFSALVTTHLTELADYLKIKSSELGRTSNLQFSRLQVFQLVKIICKQDSPQVTQSILDSGILAAVTSLFFNFCSNSVFGNEFADFILGLVNSKTVTSYTLLTQLFTKHKFLNRLIDLCEAEYNLAASQRSANFGHVIVILNHINTTASSDNQLLKSFQAQTPNWETFVQGPLQSVNARTIAPPHLRPKDKDTKRGADFDPKKHDDAEM